MFFPPFFFFLIKEATQLPANILRGKKNETCNILFQRKNKNMESSWYPHPYLHLASVLIQFTSFIVTSFIIYQTINIILERRTRWIDIPYTGWITKLSFPLPTIVRHNISEIKISKKSCGREEMSRMKGRDEKRADVRALIRRKKEGGRGGGRGKEKRYRGRKFLIKAGRRIQTLGKKDGCNFLKRYTTTPNSLLLSRLFANW